MKKKNRQPLLRKPEVNKQINHESTKRPKHETKIFSFVLLRFSVFVIILNITLQGLY